MSDSDSELFEILKLPNIFRSNEDSSDSDSSDSNSSDSDTDSKSFYTVLQNRNSGQRNCGVLGHCVALLVHPYHA